MFILSYLSIYIFIGSRSSHEVEYSLADSVGRKAETVVQKFNRIQCELTSLVEDLDSIVKVLYKCTLVHCDCYCEDSNG